MTTVEFFGLTFIAFGPPFAMFCLLIAKDPIRIIILISGAFFWLLSLLLSSILWSAVVPLKDYLVFGVTFSIIFQEMFRYIFYRIIRKAEPGLHKVSEVGVTTGTTGSAVVNVSGLGFGLMAGAFSLTNILADSIGPGTVGINGESHYFFLVSAFTTLAFILLHTFWSVIFFRACDNHNYLLIGYVIVSHFIASGITFANEERYYWLSLILIYAVMITTAVFAFHSAGGSFRNFNTIIRRR